MLSLALAAALLATPADTPGYACTIKTTLPGGYVESERFISPTGERGFVSTTWSHTLSPGGIEILALWRFKAPADDLDSGFVYFTYPAPNRNGRYRFEIQRPNGNATYPSGFQFRSTTRRPENGNAAATSSWTLLTAMAAGAPSLEAIVFDIDGDVVRRDAIDPALFGQVLAISAKNEAELDAIGGDFAARCDPMPRFLANRPGG